MPLLCTGLLSTGQSERPELGERSPYPLGKLTAQPQLYRIESFSKVTWVEGNQ
ncbi:hypothetical protein ACQ4N7_14370 [Nodosilinea sp. AN01ver1]|uniref:hypothetical protein n=1 Tax=Nodosilinea sp. AN01ver1 TaxID=3423362 RepID=UPI003D314E0B